MLSTRVKQKQINVSYTLAEVLLFFNHILNLNSTVIESCNLEAKLEISCTLSKTVKLS